MSKLKDLTGMTFGNLTVIKRLPMFEIWQNENIEYELMVALTEIYRMAIPCQADNKSEDVTTISEESRKAMKFSFSEAQRPDRKQNVG